MEIYAINKCNLSSKTLLTVTNDMKLTSSQNIDKLTVSLIYHQFGDTSIIIYFVTFQTSYLDFTVFYISLGQ